MKITAEKFWEILFTDEAFALKDWKTKYKGVHCDITPKRFEEALASLNQTLADLDHDIRLTAIQDLARAIKKVCPEVIPTIVEAARPYETFLAFLQPVEPYTDHSGTQAPKVFGASDAETRARKHGMNCPASVMGDEDECNCGVRWRLTKDAARFLEISLLMEKRSRGGVFSEAMSAFPAKLFHEWCDLAKRIEAGE